MTINERKKIIKDNIKKKIEKKPEIEKKIILNEVDNTSYLEAERLNLFFEKN